MIENEHKFVQTYCKDLHASEIAFTVKEKDMEKNK